jgi:4-aminobutyrate aminotransferase / (S)-3-amino-2-methylpropionate transaminase / 5-aminovalerate transaminase
MPMTSSAELRERDQQVILRAWASVAEPTVIDHGRGSVLVDPEGREYIDCASGLFAVNVGHSHPEVVEAIKAQAERVTQVSILQTTEPAVRLAEELLRLAPGDLKDGKAFYTVGGSESVENGWKMARQFTGKFELIVIKNAFHGLGGGSLAATGATSYKRGFGPLMSGFLRAPHAYCYRCPFSLSYPDCGIRCADEIENIITDTAISTVSEGSIAGVLVEPMQGRGGIIPPDEWLPKIRQICDKHGLLLLVDEIQTAFGRTGEMFACDHMDVVPDILILSKNVGGGLPSGMVIAKREIMDAFRTGTGPTHAGNALASAAGLAALRVLVSQELWKNATTMGQRFAERFANMRSQKYVGEARFKGLMGGIELVQDRNTKQPLPRDQIAQIKEEVLRRGVIAAASGPCGNVFRIQPPLVIDADQVDAVVAAFDDAIELVTDTSRTSVPVQA